MPSVIAGIPAAGRQGYRRSGVWMEGSRWRRHMSACSWLRSDATNSWRRPRQVPLCSGDHGRWETHGMTKAYQEAKRVGRPAGGAGPAHLLTVEHRCCGGVLLRGGVAPEEHGPTPPPSARPTATTMVGGANWIGLSLSLVRMPAKSTRS
jgi:hypothetical protein